MLLVCLDIMPRLNGRTRECSLSIKARKVHWLMANE
ncbi:Protein CBG29110 [Caenorhabditis briggsae]|uniref:Protein CBG29110 n=1 Tax=Caenorhabditis briggsae TaxID=6238 RepID=E3CTW5_CAEBR|nr:Protein CBG29110 [Caenorhabditis briggsae]CBX33036.1 Protein CBG29110 [Caenorhabditis briggsae]